MPTSAAPYRKSRENYLRILRGPSQDFVLNNYSQAYLESQRLAQCHLNKLEFSSALLAQTEQQWQAYLQQTGITSLQGVRLVTEAALLGSAIEHGLPPELIILSDGAKQFAILVHALCWVHMERGVRRLPGVTAQQRQEIEQVCKDLWEYYRQLQDYQEHPCPQRSQQLSQCFDDIFGKRYPHHYGLNLAMEQFCAHAPRATPSSGGSPSPVAYECSRGGYSGVCDQAQD